jgi:activator of HSP90 ATPase
LRGYKKTSDGRTTSYFTRELSHEEKTLAAERNAPKKIGSANGPTASTPSADSGKGNASAWNHAGTWEEKDTTEWCLERLKLRLKETLVESESLIGVVTEVKDMTGDASVAIVSGKKRYIFDFHSTVVYDIRDRDTEEVIASGSFKLPDICSTHHEELEVLVEGWKKSPSENAMVAKECRDSFVSELRQSVNLWVNDFNNTY